MSRKHYVAAARDLAIEARTNPTAARRAAQILSDIFQSDNARFDRVRFLDASGVLNIALDIPGYARAA